MFTAPLLLFLFICRYSSLPHQPIRPLAVLLFPFQRAVDRTHSRPPGSFSEAPLFQRSGRRSNIYRLESTDTYSVGTVVFLHHILSNDCHPALFKPTTPTLSQAAVVVNLNWVFSFSRHCSGMHRVAYVVPMLLQLQALMVQGKRRG